MNTYNFLMDIIDQAIVINPILKELIEAEVMDEVLAYRMSQDQANEILAKVA